MFIITTRSVIETRINIIYFQDHNENIQEKKVYQYEKLKIVEAIELLKKEGYKDFNVLKVVLEDIIIDIPVNELVKYIL